MDYFAALDISTDETHICAVDREGMVVRESKAESTAQAVANELAKAPGCRRIEFETGRMAPILFHGPSQLGLPWSVCKPVLAKTERRDNVAISFGRTSFSSLYKRMAGNDWYERSLTQIGTRWSSGRRSPQVCLGGAVAGTNGGGRRKRPRIVRASPANPSNIIASCRKSRAQC
jgi:hypothetical protein